MQPRDRIIRAIEGRKDKNIEFYDEGLKEFGRNNISSQAHPMQEFKILLFGDTGGINLLIQYIPQNNISGIIAASIRPQYHKELRKIANSLKVPFIIQPKYNSSDYPNFVKQIELISPDLIWSNSYSMIIRDDVLSLAKKTLNIHGGLLPEFRGSNPTQWSILSKASKTGVNAMHEMSSKIDEGKIVKRIEIPLEFYDSWIRN